jgi:hypothetical protein
LTYCLILRILSILGTIGLILIVLEGSLELELNKSKIGLIKNHRRFFALDSVGFSLAYLLHYYGGYSFKDSLPMLFLCVLSSAIAIPSA